MLFVTVLSCSFSLNESNSFQHLSCREINLDTQNTLAGQKPKLELLPFTERQQFPCFFPLNQACAGCLQVI